MSPEIVLVADRESSPPPPVVDQEEQEWAPPPEIKQLKKTGFLFPKWQFWIFDVIPVLLAIGISVEVFYLAQQREIAQARDDFFFTADTAHTNLLLSLRKAIEGARLLLGTLLANSMRDFPTAEVFEHMVFSNPFFNLDRTVAKVILLEAVANASRAALPYRIVVLPNMSASWDGQPRLDAPTSFMHFPVRYVSPVQPDFIGLDFNLDPLNSPSIRQAKAFGSPVATHMFQLRGGIPGRSADSLEFRNGFVYHMPIFQSMQSPSTGVFTAVPTDIMRGELLFVFWMTGVLELTMTPLNLQHTDVFLFDVSEPDFPTFVAHYESPEQESRPFYRMANISAVNPFTLQGDFQTQWIREYDIPVAQRRYRLLVRGRTDRYATRFSTDLPYILLALSLGVKALDKCMHALHHWKRCGGEGGGATI